MKYYTYESNLNDRNKIISSVDTTYGHRRYFSSLDTEVYFGAVQIDEMVAIDFTIAEPKMPIYGFNSFYPNRIVSGRRTVQGTFAINFTNPKYLLDILNSIDDSILANDYEALVYRCPEEDSTGLGIGNSAIFNKQFDITISYGYGKSENPSYKGCYQTIVGVQIVDYRQALDTEGNPILDMYTFIAKDIRYESALESTTGTQTNPTTPTQQQPTTEKKEEEKTNYPVYKVANVDDSTKLSELESVCSNKQTDGFKVTAQLYKTIDDLYYIRFGVQTVNNSTKEIENFSIVILNNEIDVNLSLSYDTLGVNSIKDVALNNQYRKDAAKLFRQVLYLNYKIDCTIEFVADVDGAKQTIELDTFATILQTNQPKPK